MPRRIGVDADGLIANPSPETPLAPPLQALVELVLDRALARPVPPHSVYVRTGEPASGAVALPRDVELIIVLAEAPAAADRRWLAALEEELDAWVRRHDPAASGATLELAGVAEVLDERMGRGLRFWLRHCCRCVHGDDLGAAVPRERPSLALARLLHGDIGARTQEALDALANARDEATVRAVCGRTARRLIWAAFALVMAREESWTTDLDRCGELVAAAHPRWRPAMHELAELARRPSAERARVARLFTAVGGWLAMEYARLTPGAPVA